ncbi:MAG TPA: PQQ-binding-like beta-propeller repeat protein, partial [Candidatus Polarisedimenticolaceae bacterium]
RFEQAVRWQRVHPMGPLVVATDGGLHGVDPSSGAIAWTRGDLEVPSEESFEVLHGTTLFLVACGRARERSLVLDAVDGHVVFDSRAAGIANTIQRAVLFDTGGLLILGQEKDDPTLKLFLTEMATGKVRWSNDEVVGGGASPGMKKLAGLLAQFAQSSLPSAVPSRPMEVGGDAVVLASGSEIWKLSTRTGKFLWRIPNRDGSGVASLFVPATRPGLLLVGTEISGQGMSTNGAPPVQTSYAAYRLEDGSPVWPKSIKVKGPLNPPVLLDDGALLSSGGGMDGGIRLVEYDTGRSAWGKNGKGIESDGGIVDHLATDAGLVVTMGKDGIWSNKGTVYALNVLDVASGTFRFQRALKVKGRLLRSEVLARGVLVVTTHEVNVFDPRTGTPLPGAAVVSDSLVTADAGASLYVFSRDDGALWRLDKPQAKLTRLGEGSVALEGGDVPRALEVVADRVTLIGAQSVVGFDLDGKVLFRSHYPAPRDPAWVRALYIAQSVRMGMASAQAGAGSAALSQYAATRDDGTLERELADELSRGYAEIADAAAGASASYATLARRRFQASAQARDFQFMMVPLENGFGIAQVDKSNGAVRGTIPIGKDKVPSYEVDDVARRVYYRPGDREILGYAF